MYLSKISKSLTSLLTLPQLCVYDDVVFLPFVVDCSSTPPQDQLQLECLDMIIHYQPLIEKDFQKKEGKGAKEKISNFIVYNVILLFKKSIRNVVLTSILQSSNLALNTFVK